MGRQNRYSLPRQRCNALQEKAVLPESLDIIVRSAGTRLWLLAATFPASPDNEGFPRLQCDYPQSAKIALVGFPCVSTVDKFRRSPCYIPIQRTAATNHSRLLRLFAASAQSGRSADTYLLQWRCVFRLLSPHNTGKVRSLSDSSTAIPVPVPNPSTAVSRHQKHPFSAGLPDRFRERSVPVFCPAAADFPSDSAVLQNLALAIPVPSDRTGRPAAKTDAATGYQINQIQSNHMPSLQCESVRRNS